MADFSVMNVVVTPAAQDLLQWNDENPIDLVKRHWEGDWGLCDDEDQQANEEGLMHGDQIMSEYEVGGDRVWVITDGEIEPGVRNATTVLLPEDY